MSALKSVDAKFERNNITFHANLVELENAILIFFYEGGSKLGTVALAMPGIGEEKAGRSSVLFGGKYLMASRALAERAAGSFGKIAVVSIFWVFSSMRLFIFITFPSYAIISEQEMA